MTEKLQVFSRDREKHSELVASEFNDSLEFNSNASQSGQSFQVLSNSDEEMLPTSKFENSLKSVLTESLENDPMFIAANQIYHLVPIDKKNAPISKTIKEIVPSETGLLKNLEFDVFQKNSRGKAMVEIKKMIPKGLFISFDQIVTLVLDELVTNACLAQKSPIPPVKIKYKESNHEVWVSVKDHAGKLAPEKIFNYLSRGLDNLFCEEKKRGSGLGLIFIYYHTSKLIFNIKQNKYTEVVVSFNKEKRDKVYYKQKKEFHLFYEKEFKMGERELEVSISTDNEITTFNFEGAINEDFTFSNLLGENSKKYIFNLEKVSLLNSCGIREWIKFINQLPKDAKLEYHNCPTVVVLQMNMVKGFLTQNSKVVSFYAPYFDEEADEEVKILLNSDQIQDGKAPVMKNDAGEELEFDGIEATFFKFLL